MTTTKGPSLVERLNAGDIGALEEAASYITELEGEVAALTKALTGLTCGGSEFFERKGERFVADIDACVSYVRRLREDAHNRTVEAIKARKAAEANTARLEGLLRQFVAHYPPGVNPFLDGAYREARAALEQTKGESA